MNVLSLFDGISCGQVALNRANIYYNNYFASEIDEYAIKITQSHFPNTIQLGDITDIKGKDLPKIDLLIGGSPCTGFSTQGKGLNFEDPQSKLFFEYVRLLREIKPRWFLLENVRMKKEYENTITSYMNVKPIYINSSLVSAQLRYRIYWTNIAKGKIKQLEDKKLYLRDIYTPLPNDKFLTKEQIKKTLSKEYLFDSHNKFIHLDKKVYCITSRNISNKIKYNNNKIRLLNLLEAEKAQTLPNNYTEGIPQNERWKCIGNGWTIDVIVHIFEYLKKELFFRKEQSNLFDSYDFLTSYCYHSNNQTNLF